MGLASVYKQGSFYRNTQWKFIENGNRQLWIDTPLSEQRGCGRIVLRELERFLSTYKDMILRKNIYVRPIEDVGGYYHKQGYHEIWTPAHKGDEDDTAVFQGEYGLWYAKAVEGEIKDEILETYDAATKTIRLLTQKRFTCLRARISIPEEVRHEDICSYLQNLCSEERDWEEKKKEISAMFLIPVVDDDVEQFMDCMHL